MRYISNTLNFLTVMIAMLGIIMLYPTRGSHALPSVQHDGLFRGARWAVDTGTRAQLDKGQSARLMSFAGLDFFSDLNFGGRHRGDLVAQVYLFDMRSLTIDPSERNAKFDYAPCVIAPNLILLPQGRLNLKVGHIWHAYGLRNQINTTQTLRQLISQENMGLMLDWGAELHGELDLLSYNVSLGSGSGKWFSRKNDTYMSVARVGLNADHPVLGEVPLKLGLSVLSARIQSPEGLIERWRAGLDLQYTGPVTILLEGSIGEDEDVTMTQSEPREALSLLAEVNWSSRDERWLVYVQQRYLSLDQLSNDQAMNDIADVAIPFMNSEMLDETRGLVSTQESATFGARFSALRDLYLASELVTQRGSSTPMFRTQIRYRW